jgi:F-type H+-transporting ATPase subunit delta
MQRVDEDIALISDGLTNSRELENFFESPIISREKKSKVIKSLFRESVAPVTMRFLDLLVEKRREVIFSSIAMSYRELRDKQSGITSVTARVAHSLSDEDRETLVGSLEQLTGKKVRLSMSVDESIVGGMVVRVGDTVYDGSVVNQLATLRERLESGSHV